MNVPVAPAGEDHMSLKKSTSQRKRVCELPRTPDVCRPHGCLKFLLKVKFVNLENTLWRTALRAAEVRMRVRMPLISNVHCTIDLVCFNKNPHRKLNMSTPRRSSRLREKNEEKEAICQSLRSKRTTPGRRREKRNVLASSSEEEEEKHEKEGLSVSEQEEEEVDVSTLISPVTAQRKPNNFLKV